MFVVCHILQSLDGKITGSFFSSEKTMNAAGKYGQLRSYYGCEATLYGTNTMAEFIGVNDHYELDEAMEHEDYIIRDVSYTVAVDTKGKLNYNSGKFIRRGNSSQIIALLTKQVSEKRLSQLREKGVSYIFAGDKELDPRLAIEKLEKKCGIGKLMIAGGGYIDWAFLKEDLIDEISLVIAPSADALSSTPSLFMKDEEDDVVKDFELISFEKVTEDALWLRYKVIRGEN